MIPDSGEDGGLRKTEVRHTRNNSQRKQRRRYFLSKSFKILLILNIKEEAGF
jgi:hypothetical protein